MSGEGSADRRRRDGADQSRRRDPDPLGETKAFQNTRTAPLEFLVVGISRDITKKNDILATPAPRRGGPGRAGAWLRTLGHFPVCCRFVEWRGDGRRGRY